MAAKRARGRKTTRRRRPGPKRRTSRAGPLANLAKKVSGIDSRVHGLEFELKTIPHHFVKKKRRTVRAMNSLEARAGKHWTTGE